MMLKKLFCAIVIYYFSISYLTFISVWLFSSSALSNDLLLPTFPTLVLALDKTSVPFSSIKVDQTIVSHELDKEKYGFNLKKIVGNFDSRKIKGNINSGKRKRLLVSKQREKYIQQLPQIHHISITSNNSSVWSIFTSNANSTSSPTSISVTSNNLSASSIFTPTSKSSFTISKPTKVGTVKRQLQTVTNSKSLRKKIFLWWILSKQARRLSTTSYINKSKLHRCPIFEPFSWEYWSRHSMQKQISRVTIWPN